MKRVLFISLIVLFAASVASTQSNKVVFGPLEGDSAGVLTVHNGEEIAIEMWIHIDHQNPSCIVGLAHGLMTEDAIIAERNGAVVDPYYDEPYWESIWIDGPFVNNPDDPFPIPEGYTGEMLIAIASAFGCDSILHILPDTGWVYYGSFLMVCNENVPIGETYYPFSMGWYPHSGQGTSWSFETPPGGGVEPEQDYCGLYFEPEITVDPIPMIPSEFSLSQNQPNPFNATTVIRYNLPEASNVTIKIYDILGRNVETLVQEEQQAGYHQVLWDASDHSSGMYFYRIEAGEYSDAKKMVLLK